MSRLRLWFSGYDAEGLEFDHWISTGSEFSCFIWFVHVCSKLFQSLCSAPFMGTITLRPPNFGNKLYGFVGGTKGFLDKQAPRLVQ